MAGVRRPFATVAATTAEAVAPRPGDLLVPDADVVVHLRLRLAPVRRVWLAESLGGLVDALTVAGLAAGLRERLVDARH